MSLTLLPVLGILFFLLGYSIHPWCENLSFFLLYFVFVLFLVVVDLKAYSFLKKDGRGVDPGERGSKGKLGRVNGRETVVGMYYMRE